MCILGFRFLNKLAPLVAKTKNKVTSPITIKENPLFTVPVFSETAEAICKVGIPIESSWHGERPHAARFPKFCLSFE